MTDKIVIKLIKKYIDDYYDLDNIIIKEKGVYSIKVKKRFYYRSEYVRVYSRYNLVCLLFNKEEQKILDKRINQYITFLN